MNQRKRNILLGVGLTLLATVGSAHAQEGATPGSTPATAPSVPPGAQGRAAKPATSQPQKASERPAAPGPSQKEARTANPRHSVVPGKPTTTTTAKAARSAEDSAKGKAKKSKKSTPQERAVRRAERRARRDLQQAERDYFAVQKLRMKAGPDSEDAIEKAARAERRAQRKAEKRLLEAQKQRARSRKPISDAEKLEIIAKLKNHANERASDRAERAKAARGKLEASYGTKLSKPAVKAELERHAWRIARLERLIEIAGVMEKKKLVDKANELVDEERALHALRLAAFAQDRMPELPAAFVKEEPKEKAGKPEKKGAKGAAAPKAAAPKAAAPKAAAKEGSK